MSKKLGDYQIPFDSKGNQQTYPEAWRGVEWKDNIPFQDELTYIGYGRGRSSATLHFKRSTGEEVVFFMSAFDELVPHMVNGKLSGRFAFVKKGANYGCVLLEPLATVAELD